MNLKSYISFVAIIFAGLFGSCDKTTVYLPIPTTFELPIPVTVPLGSSTFSEGAVIDGSIISQDILDQLDDAITPDEITQYNVEGVAYEILSTNQPGAVVNANIIIQTAGGSAQLFSITDLTLSDAIGTQIQPDLNPAAIMLIEGALESILAGNTSATIGAVADGSVVQSAETELLLLISLTVAPVVEQEVEVFDPL